MPRKDIAIAAAALVGALASGAYALSQEGDFLRDVMRALFGLSGGNTAGGQ
jgi:glycine/D-amino acid oxidase-like deaminating enzyme